MNQLNRVMAPEIESVYVFASANYSFLSSTGVKEMATFGGDVGELGAGSRGRSARRKDQAWRVRHGSREGACRTAPKIG